MFERAGNRNKDTMSHQPRTGQRRRVGSRAIRTLSGARTQRQHTQSIQSTTESVCLLELREEGASVVGAARVVGPDLRLVTAIPRLVSVIMAARGSASYIAQAVRSILDQGLPPGWCLELLIGVDDCLETLQAVSSIDDERVGVVFVRQRSGSYIVANTLAGIARGSLVTRFDSDDTMLPGRLAAMIASMEEDDRLDGVNTLFQTVGPTLQRRRNEIDGPAMGTWMWRDHALRALGGYRPWSCGADADMLCRANALRLRLRVVPERMMLYRQHGQQLTRESLTRTGSSARDGYIKRITEDRIRYEAGTIPARVIPVTAAFDMVERGLFACRVTASMASIPTRLRALRRVVDSLLPQVDRLNVYLNGHDAIPGFLRHPKVVVAWSKHTGDIGDAGKMFWTATVRGYHFTCDDDILYPSDYVAKTVATIERYGRGSVLSYHGSRIVEPFESYYRTRKTFRFLRELDHDEVVHVPGTGVAAWHTDTIRLMPEDFSVANMADVWLGVACQKQRVSVVTPAHEAGWFEDLKCYRDSIWRACRHHTGEGHDTGDLQTRVCKQLRPWRLHEPRLSGTYRESDYWQENYASGIGSGYGSRGDEAEWKVRRIVEQLQRRKCTSLLDLGSGDGELAFAIVGHMPTVRYIGMDLSTTACGLNQERADVAGLGNMEWVVGDITDATLPFADLVVCLDVLFHLRSEGRHRAALAAICGAFNKCAVVVAWNEKVVEHYHGRFAAHTFYRPVIPFLPDGVEAKEIGVPGWPMKTMYVLTKK